MTNYYVPHQKGKHRVGGKLYDKVHNVLSKERKNNNNQANKTVEDIPIIHASKNESEALQSLKTIHQSDKNLLHFWKITYLLRDRKNSLDEYFHEYPVLTTNAAISLVRDFN